MLQKTSRLIFNSFIRNKKSFLSTITTQNNKFYSVKNHNSINNNSSDEEKMKQNELIQFFKTKIKMKGPITVADFMKESLCNPKLGYYMKNDVFGSKGDFVTSPEVSQMFGELVSVWFMNEWFLLQNLYKDDLPKSIQLVELGPGRGTLMSHILRTWSQNKDMTSKNEITVYLVEKSPFMRRLQMKTLCKEIDANDEIVLYKPYESKFSPSITIAWLCDIAELKPKLAVHFFVANEFFDALPVHKFHKSEAGHYREVLIDMDENEQLTFVTSPGETVGSSVILKLNKFKEQYEHIEMSIEAARVMENICKILENSNGSVLISDYGHCGVHKDTFRGFKSHQLVEKVLENPGECDLTADVDFDLLKNIANKSQMVTYGPINQADFLKNMHIMRRFEVTFNFSNNNISIYFNFNISI
jgi:NADH dehydrogenase [ubiquinone] 1 alpha subcomplex assembly factor 7